MSRRVAALAAALLVLAVAACGNATTTAPQQQSPTALIIEITISNGKVTPTNAEFTATVGQPISLRVTSDAADELHVHSVPDHTFAVEAKPNQTFEFAVAVPGQVEVELHELDLTVATIEVQQ